LNNKLKLGQILGQWMWYYYPRYVNAKIWFPYLIFALACIALVFLWKIINKPRTPLVKEVFVICGLVFLAFSLNISVFSLSMFGLDELPQIIIHSGRTSFFTDAVGIKNVLSFLRYYPDRIEQLTHHSQVRGPGPILLFWLVYRLFAKSTLAQSALISMNQFLNLDLQYLKNLLASSGMPANDAAVSTSLFVGLLFPFLASMTIFPLYYFGKHYYDKTTAFFASAIFAIIPNVILFTPQLAQMMTFLSILVSSLFLAGIKRRSIVLASFAGLIFAISLLFGFEPVVLIPVFGLTGLFVYLCGLTEINEHLEKEEKTSQRSNRFVLLVKLCATFILAIILFYGILYLLFSFNALEAYQKSMLIHDVLEAHRPYWKWIWANLIEYSAYLGIPILFFLIRKTLRTFRSLTTANKPDIDILFLSFLSTFGVLHLSGVNRGEVARLWMFLTPFIALFVASEIKDFGSFTKFRIFTPLLFFIILFLQFSYSVNLKSILLTLPLRIF